MSSKPPVQPDASGDLSAAVQRKASFVMTMKAVAWSFFGIRRNASHAQDLAKLNPVHVIIAGILGAVVFVLSLIALIQWVIGSGVAGS
ncbi:MAG: hypothetical protein RIQ60_518 [Pseudomonadota bacterium]|jgi:hypothetical protein